MRFIDIYRNLCSSKECKKDRKEVEKLIPKGKVSGWVGPCGQGGGRELMGGWGQGEVGISHP